LRQAYDYWQDQPGNYRAGSGNQKQSIKPQGFQENAECSPKAESLIFKRSSCHFPQAAPSSQIRYEKDYGKQSNATAE
jgi:hypothetical protein